MKSKWVASGLAIALGLSGVGMIGFPQMAVAQQQRRKITAAFAEGSRLVKEGSAESLRKALGYFEEVLEFARSSNDQNSQALLLGYLGRLNSQLGENQTAIGYYNQALPISRAVGDRSFESMILTNLGDVYSSLGEKQTAIEYYNQALPISRAVGDRSGEAKTLNSLGVVYMNLGENLKAIEYCEKSLGISRVLGDRATEASIMNNLGNVYSALGKIKIALEYLNVSLFISRAVGDRASEATTLSNLGTVYSALGEKQKAIEYYNQALPILRAVVNRSGEAMISNNLGLVHNDLGEKQKAIEYYNQALQISRVVGDRSGEATTLTNLGTVSLALGEKQKAIEYYDQALPINRAVGDRLNEATTLNNLGRAYDDLGEKQKAIEYYNQSLLMSRAVRYRPAEARTLNNLGLVLKSQKQTAIAIAVYKKSINIYESLRRDIKKLPREAQELYTGSVGGTYRALADLLLTQGRTHEAQSILELLKVQELESFEKAQETKPPIQFPIHPLESQALQVIEKSITSKQPLTLETLKTIAKPLTQNRDRITQDMNNSEIAIGNPKAILNANPNAILIQNLVVNDKLWVLWTNANGNTKAIVVPNVTQKQLSETVTTFRDQIGSPYGNLNALKTTSTQLYNWLIPPQLQTELTQNPKQQLIFSLDHVTRYIPVAALYDGKQYLAQRHTLSNIITTDSNMTDRLTTEGRSPTILALGTSNPHPGFSALPNVEAELNAIVQNGNRGIYPGKIQLNETFTAQSLTDLDNYRVLHIATHGSFNPKSITASFLLLGNGDRLPITDIAKLNNLTTTHLVVLSACETGLSGGGQDGTEISGISGYFLRRGAKSVLASLWSVNDASTALMMQQFYQTLSQTPLTKAQALQKIQQDFISGKLTTKEADAIPRAGGRRYIEGQPPITSLEHPYFWAPFILTGNHL